MVLQFIRDRSKSWVSILIIAVIILTFALWGVDRLFVQGNAQATVAKVDGTKVTQAQLSVVYNQLRQQKQRQLGSQYFKNPQLPQQLKEQAIKQLVNATIIHNALKKAGYTVPPKTIDKTIAAMPFLQQNGVFSQARFNQVLAALGYTPEQFLEEVKNNLMTETVMKALVNTDFVLSNEVKFTMNLEQQRRQFSYLMIDAQTFLASTTVTAKEVQQYYQQNQASFRLPEKISINYIELSQQKIATTIKASTQQLQQYYQDNRYRYKGQSFAQATAKVKAAYIQQQAQKIIRQKSDQLTNLIYEQPNSLQAAAKALSLKIQSTALFAREGGKQGIIQYPNVVSTAFSKTVLEQGNNSDVINLPKGRLVVLRLKQRQVARVKPLAQVKPKIEKVIRQKKAEASAKEMATKIVSALQQGKKTVTTFGNEKLSWQQTKLMARTETKSGVNKSVINQAFLLALPSANQQSAAMVTVSPLQYAVVKLDKVQAGQATSHDNKQQQQAYANSLAQQYGFEVSQLYRAGLLTQAKVKYYQKNIDAVQ